MPLHHTSSRSIILQSIPGTSKYCPSLRSPNQNSVCTSSLRTFASSAEIRTRYATIQFGHITSEINSLHYQLSGNCLQKQGPVTATSTDSFYYGSVFYSLDRSLFILQLMARCCPLIRLKLQVRNNPYNNGCTHREQIPRKVRKIKRGVNVLSNWTWWLIV